MNAGTTASHSSPDEQEEAAGSCQVERAVYLVCGIAKPFDLADKASYLVVGRTAVQACEMVAVFPRIKKRCGSRASRFDK